MKVVGRMGFRKATMCGWKKIMGLQGVLPRGGCGASVTGVEEHVLCSLVLPWAMCLANSRMSVESPQANAGPYPWPETGFCRAKFWDFCSLKFLSL